MAFTYVGSAFISAQTKSVTDPQSFTLSSQLDAGNLGVLAIAVDNLTTTDGNTNNIVGVTDSVGNTWVKAREFTNGQGGSAAGACVALFYCIATTNLPAAGTITVDFSGTPTNACAVIGLEFTKGAGTTINLDGGTDVANDASQPSNLTLSSLANKEHLFVRAVANEAVLTSIFPTTGYDGGGVATSGGGGASNMGAYIEAGVITGTSSTSTMSFVTGGADNASVFIALSEVGGAAFIAKPPYVVTRMTNFRSNFY